ncbi:Helix-turn-helix of insertion element transposase [Chitinophaga sp. YR573]|uniref:phBC6A51 family helix-turn-helix protein n=1 Tax=Chitinophaga sp. YR573 TaxID=1881040 RepID=UPI0008C000B4|nr:phBC6A51 family helix-turn-helix protein [Chitinophaga sp. YR573]SEV88768.1 Helix-turn-helix of insertion element transposase [Chitinophaga sp. YR573]
MPKYTKAIVQKICELIEADDYTVSEICKQVGINESTYFGWKADAKKIEFLEAIKKAEERRLATFKAAARSGLLTLLRGKEYEEVTTEYTEDKEGKPKIKHMKKVKKVILPNPTSVIFALKNLDDENFKDLIKNEHSGGIEGSFLHLLKATSSPAEEKPME